MIAGKEKDRNNRYVLRLPPTRGGPNGLRHPPTAAALPLVRVNVMPLTVVGAWKCITFDSLVVELSPLYLDDVRITFKFDQKL